jgi:hypothetical protein
MSLISAKPIDRIAVLLLLFSALSSVPGCVDRSLSIRTDPAGARVFIDGVDVGVSPVTLPFSHYGTRAVLVRMEEDDQRGERSLAPQHRLVHLSPPWYQRFPIDIVSELLWPGTIEISYEERFVLQAQDLDALSQKFHETAREHGVIGPLEPPEDDQR